MFIPDIQPWTRQATGWVPYGNIIRENLSDVSVPAEWEEVDNVRFGKNQKIIFHISFD